jgi:plastocyanin
MPNPDEQFADDVLSAMLASIDHPAPLLRVHDVVMRARTRTKRRGALLAAAAVIAVAGVAAAAVPTSFLHRYLERLTAHRSASPTAVGATAPTANAAASRGIAFAPGAQLDVDFRAEQVSGALQVRWAEVPSVFLTQTGSSDDAHYALTPGGVIVDNGGSTADYSLVLPRSLPRAHIRVAGRMVLSKEGESVSCAGVRADSGSCVIVIGAVQSSRPLATLGKPHLIIIRMVDQPDAKFAFQPSQISALRGDTVRFLQASSAPHNVAFRARPKMAKLGAAATGPYIVTAGQTYDLVIDQRFPDGQYAFVCDPHQGLGMQGTLTVGPTPK